MEKNSKYDDRKRKYSSSYNDRREKYSSRSKNGKPSNQSYNRYEKRRKDSDTRDHTSTDLENLIEDLNDFWLFLKKYEDMLRNAGQPVLKNNINVPQKCNALGIPLEYNKQHCINLKISLKIEELYSRIPIDYDNSHNNMTMLQFEQFVDILQLYLDFKQKEKFAKLKKLRDTQKNLPVAQYKEQIIDAVKTQRVTIIAGDTGCGKSTQVPQYLYHAGFNSIACTQPRRIACISLSKRVSYEMLSEYKTTVGYQIRFERSKNQATKICFITEGLLLRQVSSDGTLSNYDVIVLDEVHERHLHGDFLLGVVKCLLHGRPGLKLVLMSATINIQLFSAYFSNEHATVIQVPGRLYPIDLNYKPPFVEAKGRQTKAERLNVEPYVQIMQLIDQKYPKTEKGDLLIFLSGMTEITAVVDAATEYAKQNQGWIILALHSTLSIAEQDKVFDYPPDGIRKCIVSTNIAETSVTIDGIRFVVDSGKVKEMSYDPKCKMQRLKEFWISRASAEQRKGRAGRTGPGVCYRLYSEKDYSEMDQYSTPELQRVPLDSLLLQMVYMGLPDARKFPFIEPPPAESIENAILSLKHHGALTNDEKITITGKALSRLPVDITIGKMLLSGSVFHQVEPVLTLAAALSVQNPFTNRAYRDHECEIARQKLESDHGDPLTLLNAYKEWLKVKNESHHDKHSTSSKVWCRRRGLEEQRFYEITKLRNQFKDLLEDCGLLESLGQESLSSSERAIRHGELKQLREMKRKYKNSAPRQRKLLRSDPWGLGEQDEEDGNVDIKDIEFRMRHDSVQVQNLVSGATACSYKDLSMLKLILCSGLFPQIAIPDEFNYCKSPNEQLFHTAGKPYTSLHPMSFFGNHPQLLQLVDQDIVEQTGLFKTKLPLSSKHQMLCYLSLLETTKPYLVNTMRMPVAQTLLLFGLTIDTNATLSRLVVDTWLQLNFPLIETGQILLLKAIKIRSQWENLLAQRLSSIEKSVENDLNAQTNKKTSSELEYELSQSMISFMNTEVCYTFKRLLPADAKSMYVGPSYLSKSNIDPNPFDASFETTANDIKGGINVSAYIVYGCLEETEWSLQMLDDLTQTLWQCSKCSFSGYLGAIDKLQHQVICPGENKPSQQESTSQESKDATQLPTKGSKRYECSKCNKILHLTTVEILRHKKQCPG